jgi:hypothetical protein
MNKTLALLALLVPGLALAQADGTPVRRRDLLGTSSSLLPSSLKATTAALNLYVETTGSDSNTCTSVAAPCLTIQGAVNKIPKTIRHPVTVTVGTGNFAGVTLDGFKYEPNSTPALGAYLNLKGTLSTATLDGGVATSTASSGTAGTANSVTWGTLTDTSQTADGGTGWVVDALRGFLVETLTGTGSGQIRPIHSNTDTAITVAGSWTAPASGTTYAIRDWGTVCTTAAPWMVGFEQAQIAGEACVVVHNVAGDATISPVAGNTAIEKMKFANSAGRGVLVHGMTAPVQVRRVRFNSTTAYSQQVGVLSGPGNVQVESSYASLPANNELLFGQSSGAAYGVAVRRTVVDLASSADIITLTSSGTVLSFMNSFKGGTGFIVKAAISANVYSYGDIFNCNSSGGTAISTGAAQRGGVHRTECPLNLELRNGDLGHSWDSGGSDGRDRNREHDGHLGHERGARPGRLGYDPHRHH